MESSGKAKPRQTIPTVSKTIRYQRSLVEAMEKLLRHFPEYEGEEPPFYRDVLWDGHLLRAVQATRPGHDTYGGYDPDDLAAQLLRRLRPVFQFLVEQGQLPKILPLLGLHNVDIASLGTQLMAGEATATAEEDVEQEGLDLSRIMDTSAADTIAEAGGGFLDDFDD